MTDQPRRRGPVAGVREARELNEMLRPHRETLGALHERIAVARAMASVTTGIELRAAISAAQEAFEKEVLGLPDPKGVTGDLRRAYSRAVEALSEV